MYSLEAPYLGASHEYPQFIFLGKKKKEKNICLHNPLISSCEVHEISKYRNIRKYWDRKK